MPLLQINAGADGLHMHQTSSALLPSLVDALDAPGPIITMVHGYKFSPNHERGCPHRHILSLTPREDCWKAKSWPKHLGFGQGNPREGTAIAFGWRARGTIWQAHQEARLVARQLAELIAALHRLAPSRAVHILAHSMGARVALSALEQAPAKSVGRVILLNPAEYGTVGQRALKSAAGRSSEIISVTSRDNLFFDFLFERLISRPEQGDRNLTKSLPQQANTLTLHLDHASTIAVFRELGFPVPDHTPSICHWSTYLMPGMLEVYRNLLRDTERYTLTRLRKLLQDTTSQHAHRRFGMLNICRERRDQTALSSAGMTMSTINQ